MLNFCKKVSELVIYGAGEVAKEVSQLLEEANVEISCYIVSSVDGIPKHGDFDGRVMTLSKWIKKYDNKKNIGILVAVSKKYIKEIEEMLAPYNLNIFYLENDDLKKARREIHPVESSMFLNTIKPVSRLFGTDRGKPIDRYYIELFLNQKSVEIQNADAIIEIAEDTYSKKYFPNADHDILRYNKGMDLTKADTLPENKYDVFICTQALHEIYEIKSAIHGCYQLLKPGGVLLATVAGNISQIADHDYARWGYFWGFTDMSIKKLMAETFGEENVEVFPYGNIMAATAFIQGVALEDLPDLSLLDENDPTYSICIGVIARKW